MSVSATTLSRLVKTFSATTATISTICASVKPASRTAWISASATWPRSRTILAAKRTAALAFASPEAPWRLSAISSGADLGQVQAEIGVRRQAVVAAVDLGDGQRDALAGLDVEGLAERAVVGGEALQRGRAGGDQAEHVGDDAELLACTASRIGLEASGTSSRAGMARRDMGVLLL